MWAGSFGTLCVLIYPESGYFSFFFVLTLFCTRTFNSDSSIISNLLLILGLQPRDKAATLGVKTI